MNDRTLIVHNGADPARLKPRGHSIRRELGIADDANLIGMVANFYRDDRKDQLTVCRALPDVLDRFPDTHCFFAGRVEDGGEEKLADCLSVCIENEIADRVHFLGARNDVPDLLAETDIFVFSTLYEGLPIAVCEAMLTGVPIVASDIEPLMEISRDGEFAEIFPVRDAAALSERLSLLISDDDRRNGLAMRAKAFADSHYSISAHLVSLRSLYERLLA